MSALERIRPALLYIDAHLQQQLRVEEVAALFHFSPYYFHRVFTSIVGQPMAAYIRSRRLEYACAWLVETNRPLVDIAMDSGFESAQAFSRAFRRAHGMPPGAWRAARPPCEVMPVALLVRRFANRLKGGILLNPKIIKKEAMHIVGSVGGWQETAQVWADFEAKAARLGKHGDHNGYEVRIWNGHDNPVYAGHNLRGQAAPEGFASIRLPAGEYAAFEVFVSDGYDSENDAMAQWLQTNGMGYAERLLDGAHFVVEFYDGRFEGDESGSIVEIWVPIARQA